MQGVFRSTYLPFLFLTIAGLLLSTPGCSVITPHPQTENGIRYNWPQIRAQILKQTSWSLIGKVGVRTPNESMTAAINNWSQIDDIFRVDLSSTFLGLGSSKLIGNSTYLTLEEAGEAPISSDRPNELIESALGIPLPIAYLPYWIKALPTPDATFDIEFNPQGLPSTMTQHQWHLQFSQYRPQHGIPLPGKIKLESNGTRITLAIKKWTLPSL